MAGRRSGWLALVFLAAAGILIRTSDAAELTQISLDERMQLERSNPDFGVADQNSYNDHSDARQT
jgi:hypothetical protein